MQEIELTYARQLFTPWKAGRLHGKWFSKYRALFDADDLRLARHQHGGGYHFGEWFTAIHYRKKGYRVLQSKYANPNHRTRHAKALSLLGKEQLAWLWKKGRPDLLVYSGSRFFFVEVKRDCDRLSGVQKQRLTQIEERFGCRVYVIRLRAEHRSTGGPGETCLS